MEDILFDAMTKALGSQQANRRLTLGALLGGALSYLGLASTEAKRSSGKCKPKCGECKKCKKGDCKKKHGKKVCKKAKCQAKGNGTGCSSGTCQSGRCVAAAVLPPPAPICPPDCAAPKVCCGGVCCDPVHECNAAGTCATCEQVCAPNCGSCANLANGGTQCSSGGVHFCTNPCSALAPCPPERPHCVESVTFRDGTGTTINPCPRPIVSGAGACAILPACAS